MCKKIIIFNFTFFNFCKQNPLQLHPVPYLSSQNVQGVLRGTPLCSDEWISLIVDRPSCGLPMDRESSDFTESTVETLETAMTDQGHLAGHVTKTNDVTMFWFFRDPRTLTFTRQLISAGKFEHLLQSPTGGHLIIGRTQLSDVASFRALQTRICEIWIQCCQLHEKLKPHRKNCQITTNNKHFTEANVHHPFPPTICTYGGSEELQNLKLFF